MSLQVNPSPEYPALQVQVRPPSVFPQFALALHPPLFIAHSSMSLHAVFGSPLYPLGHAQVSLPLGAPLSDATLLARGFTGFGPGVFDGGELELRGSSYRVVNVDGPRFVFSSFSASNEVLPWSAMFAAMSAASSAVWM